MKVLGIVGSNRKKGNTDTLIESALSGVKSTGVEVEKIFLSDYKFVDCKGCEGCHYSHRCIIKDGMQEIYDKMDESDGLILGSPTYFYNVTGITKCFLDRLYQYEIFDDDDRSVWLTKNEIFGMKYAVTVAVCEQNSIEDMGVTSEVMNKTLAAVGYRVVSAVKALKLFERGSALRHEDIINTSYKAGIKLGKTLLLAQKTKQELM